MNPVTSEVEFTPEEAFVALAIVAASIDGEHNETEDMAVTQAILNADLFANHPADQLIMMINNSFSQINEQGTEVIFQSAIQSLPETLWSEALTAAAQIIMADGKVSSEEQTLLNKLGQAFNLPEEEINNILQKQG
jgi:tellurite resistance protein